jgi:hypothetical protein
MTVTAKAVLFAQADPGTAAAKSPGWTGVLGGLGQVLSSVSAAGKAAVERELSAALGRLLEQDLGQLLIAGLRHHGALVAAARATEENPAAVEVVQLAAHSITSTHHPYVDVVINGVKLTTVHFDLDFTFDVDALVGTVRSAKLVNIQSGHCLVTVALAYGGYEIASRQVPLDLAVTIQLGDGVDLLTEERRPASTP